MIRYSYDNGLSHIPSALSMYGYLKKLFYNRLVTPEDHIVIGKPFGAQAYYLVWRNMGYLDNIELLSSGVKHDEIDFVDYSEETMGNALGVGAGIGMASDKMVWINISDASLQMGNTLEAIQYIGHNQLNNIALTIDYNGSQVTGNTNDILSVDPIIEIPDGLADILLKALSRDPQDRYKDMDMFMAMRLTATLHKALKSDAAMISAAQVLHMATLNGAKALGAQDRLGRGRSGRPATPLGRAPTGR